MQVITNAGTGAGSSWQWNVREAARTSPGWFWGRLNGQAKWITPAVLEEQRRLLPPTVYQRLWLNEWVTGGDALPLADIEGACTLAAPMLGNEPGFTFCAGLDLGIKNDHSALVVLGVHRDSQRIRLAHTQSWAPPGGGSIDLEAVAAAVRAAHKRFNLKRVSYDPYQCALMAQQLSRVGVPMNEMAFAGANLNIMASTLLECFRSRRLDLYRDDRLIKDLTQLCIVEKSYGFKLEATRSAAGHADVATALAIALPYAKELLSKKCIDLGAWLSAGAFDFAPAGLIGDNLLGAQRARAQAADRQSLADLHRKIEHAIDNGKLKPQVGQQAMQAAKANLVSLHQGAIEQHEYERRMAAIEADVKAATAV